MPLYFAYGSCMNADDLARTVDAIFVNSARLENYRLAFTRYSNGRKGGVADIVPSKGDYVEGVLMLVPDFKALDAREGHPYVYKRKRIKVLPKGHEAAVYASTYVVVEKESCEVLPHPDYVRLIREGAAQFLSAEYQNFLEQLLAIERKEHKPKTKRNRHDPLDSASYTSIYYDYLMEERERRLRERLGE